jgi:hypothetical protein
VRRTLRPATPEKAQLLVHLGRSQAELARTVSDAATAVLFEDFYSRLHEPGTSRAAAMRAAQRDLLDSDRFNHLFFWSGFLLIDSWL